MVKQAVQELFTYYHAEYPDGQVKAAPLQGRGKVWVLGSYKHPSHPSPEEVRVGESGVKVWMVMQWLRLSDNDPAKLLERYGQVLQPEDVEAALWYYKDHRIPIDHRIAEEETA